MDGLELLRKIRDGEIEVGTIIFDSDGNEYVYKEMFECVALLQKDKAVPGLYEEPCCSMFTDKDTEFTIAEKEEKEEDIDIQNIPEYEPTLPIEADDVIIIGIINRLVKAVKQLDKKLEE